MSNSEIERSTLVRLFYQLITTAFLTLTVVALVPVAIIAHGIMTEVLDNWHTPDITNELLSENQIRLSDVVGADRICVMQPSDYTVLFDLKKRFPTYTINRGNNPEELYWSVAAIHDTQKHIVIHLVQNHKVRLKTKLDGDQCGIGLLAERTTVEGKTFVTVTRAP
ncbi:MAG: hypothetical protein RIC14_16085 [Filomicrobium sp.]